MSYRVVTLDSDLNPTGVIGRVSSIDVDRDITDDVPLLESCTIEFDQEQADFGGGWCRIEWRGDTLVSLGVYRLEADSVEFDLGCCTVRAKGYSVLKPADEETLQNGAYAPAGSSVPDLVRQYLGTCPGPVVTSGLASLGSNVVFDDGASKLEAAWAVLDAAGWRLRLPGDGSVIVEPMPSTATLVIDNWHDHGIQPGISISDEISYTRELGTSGTMPGDLVRVSLPQAGIDGTYRVLAQNLGCGPGVTVEEEIGDLNRDD